MAGEGGQQELGGVWKSGGVRLGCVGQAKGRGSSGVYGAGPEGHSSSPHRGTPEGALPFEGTSVRLH
jgi:hypothetical protein